MGLSWEDAFTQLDEVGSLPDDWDGNGSPKVDRRILQAATDMLCLLGIKAPAPFTCPIPNGSLQFEWGCGDRHVEVEFAGPDSQNVLVLRHDKHTGHMETEEICYGEIGRILEHLDWLGAA